MSISKGNGLPITDGAGICLIDSGSNVTPAGIGVPSPIGKPKSAPVIPTEGSCALGKKVGLG